MHGWIKLHRTLTQWQWYSDSKTIHLFIHLLLNACHEPQKWQDITLQKGQLVVGRQKLASALNMTQNEIRQRLHRLKTCNAIVIKCTNKYSLVTITNWESYQNTTEKRTNKSPAKHQQTTTNKKGKNKKKYSNIDTLDFSKFSNSEKSYFTTHAPNVNIPDLIDTLKNYCHAHGKVYKNYYSALQNFAKNAQHNINQQPINQRSKPHDKWTSLNSKNYHQNIENSGFTIV